MGILKQLKHMVSSIFSRHLGPTGKEEKLVVYRDNRPFVGEAQNHKRRGTGPRARLRRHKQGKATYLKLIARNAYDRQHPVD